MERRSRSCSWGRRRPVWRRPRQTRNFHRRESRLQSLPLHFQSLDHLYPRRSHKRTFSRKPWKCGRSARRASFHRRRRANVARMLSAFSSSSCSGKKEASGPRAHPTQSPRVQRRQIGGFVPLQAPTQFQRKRLRPSANAAVESLR